MQQDYTPESFKKGQQFEDFVERKIFTKDRYELITRTNTYEQNVNRYAEDTLKPDFKFRCKKTGQEFWVEAKYRSDFYKEQIEGLKYSQRDRFYSLSANEGVPIFIIIGYWGHANNPGKLSLIPLQKYQFIKMYRSFLREYEVSIGSLSNQVLNLQTQKPDIEIEDHIKEEILQSNLEKVKGSELTSKSKKHNSKMKALLVMGLVIIILTIYSLGFSNGISEKPVRASFKVVISDYYQAMNSNQIEKLPEFLSPHVTSWYGNINPTQEEIYQNAKAHRGKYPYSSSEIDWDTLKIINEEGGAYTVIYELMYQSKEKITDDYKVFNLKLITQWDANFKLKSISEVRL